MPVTGKRFVLALVTGLVCVNLSAQDVSWPFLTREIWSDMTEEEALAVVRENDVNADGHHGMTALMMAAWLNREPSVIRALIAAGADIGARTDEGFTAFMFAARSSSVDVLEALQDAGAVIDTWSYLGGNTLMSAATGNTDPAVIRFLLNHGANVNEWDSWGLSVLMGAAWQNPNPDVVRALMDAGADVNAVDRDPVSARSALLYAARYNNSDVLQALIERGADVNVVGRDGDTALMWAARTSTNRAREPERIEVLIRAGAALESRDKHGATALRWAADYQQEVALTTLVRAGADVDTIDSRGVTPLMRLAAYADHTLVKVVIDAGASVSVRDAEGLTALMYAARDSRDVETLNLLLDAGARPEDKDKAGRTALDWIQTNAHLSGSDAQRRMRAIVHSR